MGNGTSAEVPFCPILRKYAQAQMVMNEFQRFPLIPGGRFFGIGGGVDYTQQLQTAAYTLTTILVSWICPGSDDNGRAFPSAILASNLS